MSGRVRGPPTRLVRRTAGQALPTLQSPGCASLRPAWCDILQGKHCLPCNHLGARASDPPRATYCGVSIAHPAITWVRGSPARLVQRTAGRALPTLQSPRCAGLRPAWCNVLRGKHCLPCNHLGARASNLPMIPLPLPIRTRKRVGVRSAGHADETCAGCHVITLHGW